MLCNNPGFEYWIIKRSVLEEQETVLPPPTLYITNDSTHRSIQAPFRLTYTESRLHTHYLHFFTNPPVCLPASLPHSQTIESSIPSPSRATIGKKQPVLASITERQLNQTKQESSLADESMAQPKNAGMSDMVFLTDTTTTTTAQRRLGACHSLLASFMFLAFPLAFQCNNR